MERARPSCSGRLATNGSPRSPSSQGHPTATSACLAEVRVQHRRTPSPTPHRTPRSVLRRAQSGAAGRTQSVVPRRTARTALANLGILLAFLGAACGGPTPPIPPSPSPSPSPTPTRPPAPTPAASPTPAPDPSVVYAEIADQVVAIRGLSLERPLEPHVLDEAAASERILAQFDRDNPPELLEPQERLLIGLDLLPPAADLRALYHELLTSQVAGFYDPDKKEMVVLSRSGSLGPTERTTYAHELTHALQDQHFGLDGLEIDAVGQGDRGLARLALVEGDATLVMTYWAQQHLSQAELIQLVEESQDPKALAVLQRMPAVLRESLLFPYSAGLQFVLTIQAREGWAGVDAAFRRPPDSTEQILHPAAFGAGGGVRDEPEVVTIPDELPARLGAGWKKALEDTAGEFLLRLWLREVGGLQEAAATAAAAGWGGDRVALYENGDRFAIVLATAWDSTADATEFADALNGLVGRLDHPASLVYQPGSSRVTVLIASDAPALTDLDRALAATGV